MMKIPERPESGHEAMAGFLTPGGEGAWNVSFKGEASGELDVGLISRYVFMLVAFPFSFDRSVSNHVRKLGGTPPQKSLFCRASADIDSGIIV
jgi:hypothetical protein